MPGAEVDAVRGDQLDLFVVGLELERGEREIVEDLGLIRHKRSAVQLKGQSDVNKKSCGADQNYVGHFRHPFEA